MIDILYQDESMVVVNKPAGWLVHRSWLDRKEKIVLMQTLRDQINRHVYTIHRLDRPTSGALILALSTEVARLLSLQFEQNRVDKYYHAIVRGYVSEVENIDYPLIKVLDKIADKYARQEQVSQEAMTTCYPVARLEIPVATQRYATSRYSLVQLQPHTGRKHQLRRHMKHIRRPIVGDTTYGDLNQNRAFASYFNCSRLMLHASKIFFTHPVNQQKLEISAPFDAAWQSILTEFMVNEDKKYIIG